MVKEINEFLSFSEFIENKITPQHYLIRYTNLVVRYISLRPNDEKTSYFLKTFTADKYLKIIQYVRASEQKYKKLGCTLSQQHLQSLIFLYNNQYDTLQDAEEDDFNKIIKTEHQLLHDQGDHLEEQTI